MSNDTAQEIRLLVISDIHLRPTGDHLSAEGLLVEGVDAIVSLGDVIDDNREHAKSAADGERYEELGREFFSVLDQAGVPVFAVPGNHDPSDCMRRLVDECQHVQVLHRETKTVDPSETSGSLRVAGWGCEQFDFTPALLAPEYPHLGVPEADQLTPNEIADVVLDAGGRYLAGAASPAEVAEALGISPDHESRERLHQSLDRLESRFEAIVDSTCSGPGPLILTSHITPFNVPFDCRGLTSRTGSYHFGSLALRLASMDIGPACLLSGHTHQRGTTVIETGSGYTYVHNPGAPGVSVVTIRDEGVRFRGGTIS